MPGGEPTKPMRRVQPRVEPESPPGVMVPSEGFGREPITPDELAALQRLVAEMTERSVQAPNLLEQRRALFAIGDAIRVKRPTAEQGSDVLNKMSGFKLELAGRKLVIDRFISRGTFGAVFKVSEEGGDPAKEMVLKVSLPFDRRDMFVESGATMREVVKAEKCRNLIMEVAALDALTKEVVIDQETGEKTSRRMMRQGGVPPVPILIGAQLIPEPLKPGEPPRHSQQSPDRRIAAILMEEIDGQTLDLINDRWDIGQDSRYLINLGVQLATGLKYIHERGVFHSDIKLRDIKINQNQDVIFMDLGSASVEKISKRHADEKSGAVNYGRSEGIFAAKDYVTQMEGPSVGRDIYALGIVMSKLLYGEHFKRARDREKILSSLPPASLQVAELIRQMTLLNPESRPTLDQLIDSLRQIEV